MNDVWGCNDEDLTKGHIDGFQDKGSEEVNVLLSFFVFLMWRWIHVKHIV